MGAGGRPGQGHDRGAVGWERSVRGTALGPVARSQGDAAPRSRRRIGAEAQGKGAGRSRGRLPINGRGGPPGRRREWTRAPTWRRLSRLLLRRPCWPCGGRTLPAAEVDTARVQQGVCLSGKLNLPLAPRVQGAKDVRIDGAARRRRPTGPTRVPLVRVRVMVLLLVPPLPSPLDRLPTRAAEGRSPRDRSLRARTQAQPPHLRPLRALLSDPLGEGGGLAPQPQAVHSGVVQARSQRRVGRRGRGAPKVKTQLGSRTRRPRAANCAGRPGGGRGGRDRGRDRDCAAHRRLCRRRCSSLLALLNVPSTATPPLAAQHRHAGGAAGFAHVPHANAAVAVARGEDILIPARGAGM